MTSTWIPLRVFKELADQLTTPLSMTKTAWLPTHFKCSLGNYVMDMQDAQDQVCNLSMLDPKLGKHRFWLSFLVSIPVPTYYAELDRERASRHLYESVRFQFMSIRYSNIVFSTDLLTLDQFDLDLVAMLLTMHQMITRRSPSKKDFKICTSYNCRYYRKTLF